MVHSYTLQSDIYIAIPTKEHFHFCPDCMYVVLKAAYKVHTSPWLLMEADTIIVIKELSRIG